jgi:hypothetical protein
LQDVLSSIGGIHRVILTIASGINLLVNYFIILIDTEELVLNRDEDNFIDPKFDKRLTILRKANQIMFPPRRVYSNKNNQQKTNYQRLMKDGVYIYSKENSNIRDEKEGRNQNIYIIRNLASNNCNNYYYENNKDRNYLKSKDLNNLENKGNFIKRSIGNNESNDFTRRAFRLNTNKNMDEDIQNHFIISKNEKVNNKDLEDRSIEKQNFNWLQYIWYLICCQKNNPNISYYEDFRAKLISEENIIQTYLDVYQLLKTNHIPKKINN